MACSSLPTCGLALAETERYLPGLITRLEALLAEVGLAGQEIIIRMTGCPNGCARPYMAEIGFVGKAPGRYQIWLGGNEASTRLNRLYRGQWSRTRTSSAELRPPVRALRRRSAWPRSASATGSPACCGRSSQPPPTDSLMTPDQLATATPSCAASRRSKSSAGPSPRPAAAPSSPPISAPTRPSSCTSATQAQPDIPVLWVDHGYNRPATYRHAEQLRTLLRLNLKAYLPSMTAAHHDAIHGPIPTDRRTRRRSRQFSAADETGTVPARHEGTRAHRLDHRACARCKTPTAPASTSCPRTRISTPSRSARCSTGATRTWRLISNEHNLPNEWDYFDPAKADEKRECGLHAAWGSKFVARPGIEGEAAVLI